MPDYTTLGLSGLISLIISEDVSWSTVPLAFGFGTAEEQIKSSIALAIISILSSVVTLGLSLVLLVLWAVTISIGLLRLIPFVDTIWVIGDD